MADLKASPWRVRAVLDRPPRPDASYVLYWTIAARRSSWNFALDRAIDWADELGTPLLILDVLRCDYQWANHRFHQFAIDGMRDNADAFRAARLEYYPYLESSPGSGLDLLATLARDAAVVVTDRSPLLELPPLVAKAASRIDARFEEVDVYGIVPLDAPAVSFPTAFAFRRYLQRSLRGFLEVSPRPVSSAGRDRSLAAPLDAEVRWPRSELESVGDADLSRLPIDREVRPVTVRGGATDARAMLDDFVERHLPDYLDRSHPDADAGSGLSPYLHFGHTSPHEVLFRILEAEEWSTSKLADGAAGKKEGWWGISPPAEAFLDQLVTWRELGANTARRDDYTEYDALPEWAKSTLAAHGGDLRSPQYSLDAFAAADTHDDVWNAAQRELVRDGRLHNYMRMLWGKKILEWSASPREALAIMIEVNNRYALDGRDPNSYSGIFWVLGRYDRPWGPERAIFGTVRYMSSQNAVRKLRMRDYLHRYGPTRLF